MKRLFGTALAAFGGFFTVVLVLIFDFWVAMQFDIDLLSFTFFFVLPIGSAIGGALAASGFYGGAKRSHLTPSKPVGVLFAAIVVCGWAMFEVAPWVFFSGAPGNEPVGFFDFWAGLGHQLEDLDQHPRSHRGERGALGWWGYARELLVFGGWCVGAWVVWIMLEQVPRCDECQRFTRTTPILGSESDVHFAHDAMERAGIVHAELAAVAGQRETTTLDFVKDSQCTVCLKRWAHVQFTQVDGNSKTARLCTPVPLSDQQHATLWAQARPDVSIAKLSQG